MTSAFAASLFPARFSRLNPVMTRLAVATFVLALAGCDWKSEKPSTQAAARVNDQEITVHQINHVLEQQVGLVPEQAASASRQVLSRLIDQEVALQEGQKQKLDRDPKVVRQLEAARRDVIARAYTERVGASVARPSAEDIRNYYESNPALFKERRVYRFEELAVEAKPEQIEALKAAHQAAKSPAVFVEHLKAQGLKFSSRRSHTPAERLPLAQLAPISKMSDGQAIFSVLPQGLVVLTLLGSDLEPVDEERARPAIEQFLINERRQKAIQSDIAALRATAKIEYVGEFAAAASAPSGQGGAAAPSTMASGILSQGAEKELK